MISPGSVKVCRDMVDLKKLATKKMLTAERAAAAAMKKQEREEGKVCPSVLSSLYLVSSYNTKF